MYIHKEWGTIFEIGDFVKYRNIRGMVIEVILPKNFMKQPKAGYYKVKYDDNKEYFDYHYIFELDREKARDNKLNSLLNE